jgi:hypothetical protein
MGKDTKPRKGSGKPVKSNLRTSSESYLREDTGERNPKI